MTRHWIALLRPAKKEATSRASENFWKISALQPSWNFQPPGLRKWWFLIGHLLGVWTARIRSTNNHHDRRDPKNTRSIHPSVDTQVAPLFEKNIAEESISSSSLQTRRCNCLVWINHEHYMMTWWPNSSEGGPYWPSGAVGKWVPWVPPIYCGWSVDSPKVWTQIFCWSTYVLVFPHGFLDIPRAFTEIFLEDLGTSLRSSAHWRNGLEMIWSRCLGRRKAKNGGNFCHIWMFSSMDWLKGKFTGKPHNPWENLWFPVDFPLNQSIETYVKIDSIRFI